MFCKIKRKPTAQREHFQQSSYPSVRCFGKLNGNQHSENTSNKAVIYLFDVSENETETSTARILPTKQLSICWMLWKMKKKPTQREHFQQISYISAGCFGKWNRNEQHSENTSNKAGRYLSARCSATQVHHYCLQPFFLFVCLFVCMCVFVCVSFFFKVSVRLQQDRWDLRPAFKYLSTALLTWQ